MPRLLDLFCGAGGASWGYHLAGFEVVGVDHLPQPHYPLTFVQADALTYPLDGFDLVHASPPCQRWSTYGRRPEVGDRQPSHPDLLTPTRARLQAHGVPYILENVPGAPLLDPIQLCGSSFGLDVRRHRLFESSLPLVGLPCDHAWQTPRFPPAGNRTRPRCTVEVGVYRILLSVQQAAMGIPWMQKHELSQAVPPAYTEFLGRQLLGKQ